MEGEERIVWAKWVEQREASEANVRPYNTMFSAWLSFNRTAQYFFLIHFFIYSHLGSTRYCPLFKKMNIKISRISLQELWSAKEKFIPTNLSRDFFSNTIFCFLHFNENSCQHQCSLIVFNSSELTDPVQEIALSFIQTRASFIRRKRGDEEESKWKVMLLSREDCSVFLLWCCIIESVEGLVIS